MRKQTLKKPMGHTLVTVHVMTWDVDEPYLKLLDRDMESVTNVTTSLSSLKILFTQVQWRRQGTRQKGARSSLPTVEQDFVNSLTSCPF